MSARKHEWPVFAHLRSFHLGSWSNLMPSFEGCCQSVASCCVKMPPTISIKSHGQDLMLETHWCFRRPMPQAHMWNLSIVPDTAENAYPDAENAYPYAENALTHWWFLSIVSDNAKKRIPICRKRIHHMLKTHRSLDSWCHKQALDLGKKTVERLHAVFTYITQSEVSWKMVQHSSSHSSEQFSRIDTSADVLHLDCPLWLQLK